MKMLDLFCGLKGWSQPFLDNGWEVDTLDIDPQFSPDICMDILDWWPTTSYDVVLASPPCEAFSVMSIGHHWGGGRRAYEPKTTHAELSVRIVQRTVAIIEAIQPKVFVIENPRGVLRKLGLIPYQRQTVWYCRYGESRAKPTDLWGGFPSNWVAEPECHNGNSDHIAAPRGSRTGTQGGMSRAERAKIPYDLAESIRVAI